MDELKKQISVLEEIIVLLKRENIAVRRSLMEARTIIVNECSIDDKTKDEYIDWLLVTEKEGA